jgi:hypothetical protein
MTQGMLLLEGLLIHREVTVVGEEYLMLLDEDNWKCCERRC